MGHSDQLHILGILEDSYGQVYQMMHEHQASLKSRRAKVYREKYIYMYLQLNIFCDMQCSKPRSEFVKDVESVQVVEKITLLQIFQINGILEGGHMGLGSVS